MELKFGCVDVLINYMYTGVLEAGDCALDDLKKVSGDKNFDLVDAKPIKIQLCLRAFERFLITYKV